MDPKSANPDRLIARIAARQHGVVRLDQLAWAGLSPTQVKRRLQAGRLHRLYRGVFALGHPHLSQQGHWIAAVFACGPGAVLSYDSAAALWKLASSPTGAVVHVTVPSSNGRKKRPGIVLHRSRILTPRDTTLRLNIPVTTPERTRHDLGWDREPTRSHLERRFLRLVKESGLQVPEVNVPIGPYTVDFLWRAEKLVVEIDGYAFHSSRSAFEADRRRDRFLHARGFTVLRFTYREVTDTPAIVIDSLRAQFSRAA